MDCYTIRKNPVLFKTSNELAASQDLITLMISSDVWFSMEGTLPVAQYLSQRFSLAHIVDAVRRIMIYGV